MHYFSTVIGLQTFDAEMQAVLNEIESTLNLCLWLPSLAVCRVHCTVVYLAWVICITTEGHQLTVLECIRFQRKERTINIPQEINTSYCQFGIFLLNDLNGTRTCNIEHEHREHAEKINTEILREWAMGRGKQPVSWKTLTEVLRDIELGTLASEIEVA